jgi:hypothetical protein
MPVFTARRGRFPRAASTRVQEPEVQQVRDSSSSSSCDEDGESDDEDGEEDGLEELDEPTTTRLHAEKDCFEFAEEDTFSFSLWVEVEGEELRVYRPREDQVDIKEGWIISEQGKVRR